MERRPQCATCLHPKRAEIERLLAAGHSLRKVAAQVGGISAWTLHRHLKHEARPQVVNPPATATTTAAPAAAVMVGTPSLEQAIREALAEQVIGQDFVRRPQMMRLARSIVGQAISGRSAALHLLFSKLWPDAPRPLVGELVVNNTVGIGVKVNADGQPLTQQQRNERLIATMRELYGISPEAGENRAAVEEARKAREGEQKFDA